MGLAPWEKVLPPEGRAIFVGNAPTFLDELQDREALTTGEDALSRLEILVRLTDGSESPPVFRRAIDRLTELIARVTRETIEGADVPHFTAPERYVELTTRAVLQHAAA